MFGFNSLTPYGRNPERGFLENFFNDSFPEFNFGSAMKTDIRETDDAYTVVMDIPGASKDNIALNYDQNEVLSVCMKQAGEKKTDRSGYIRRERFEGSSRRDFYLPGVDPSGIAAKYENGTLQIELPKNKNGKQSRSIEIQ